MRSYGTCNRWRDAPEPIVPHSMIGANSSARRLDVFARCSRRPGKRGVRWLLTLAWVILLIVGLRARAANLDVSAVPLPPTANVVPQGHATPQRRVYVPHTGSFNEAAIFWFGRVTPDVNYTDVRLIAADDSLLLALRTFDRRLWYNANPSPGTLTDWDAASVYLNLSGAVGELPGDGSYRFDVQLSWSGESHPNFQTAYRGDAGQWVLASVPFTASTGWIGDVPNNNTDDRGWLAYYTIPYVSLGLAGRPPQGTVWGLGVAVHDRDSAAGPPFAAQVWPETMMPLRPASWGQLHYGLKPVYIPAPALPRATAVIRHGLNGVTVIDAAAGGSNLCGDAAAPNYFLNWGELNYAGEIFLNVQRTEQQMDWPCDSRPYVTFPLYSLPQGKVVLSATLTLYQFGNAGAGASPGPQPSFIQVFTVREDWAENTLTWNNAPLAGDYVGATWVDPLDETPPWPGIPRHWDVSGAVAEAYATGAPLRLALYSPNWPMNSGKYFFSSDAGGDGAPTLTVTWGDPVAQLEKRADRSGANYSEDVTYVLKFRSPGTTLILTDTLASGVDWLDDVRVYGTEVFPVYDQDEHRLTWTASLVSDQQVFITYTVSVNTVNRELLTNVAELVDQERGASRVVAVVIANPYRIYLPVIVRAY